MCICRCMCVSERVCVSWSVVLFSLLHAECCISHAGGQMSHIYHVLTQSQTEWGTQANSEVVQSMCSYVWQKHKQTHTLLSAQAWSNPFIVRDWYTLPSRVSLSLFLWFCGVCLSCCAARTGAPCEWTACFSQIKHQSPAGPAVQHNTAQHSTLC